MNNALKKNQQQQQKDEGLISNDMILFSMLWLIQSVLANNISGLMIFYRPNKKSNVCSVIIHEVPVAVARVIKWSTKTAQVYTTSKSLVYFFFIDRWSTDFDIDIGTDQLIKHCLFVEKPK